jgi:predicted nucleic acid-binding Zn ribbon protein
MQKISDPEASVCPHCQKTALKRLVSAAGFQLKGTGWYVTDFRNKEKSGTEKPKTHTPAEKSTSAKESSTDIKPTEKKSEATKTDTNKEK